MVFSIDAHTHTSPNYDRHGDDTPVLHTPLGILLHSGEGTERSDLDALTNPHIGDPRIGKADDPRVSANYYITKDGRIFQLVPDDHRAWHAGVGHYDGLYDWNLALGVENEHKAGQGRWPAIQVAANEWLCRGLIARYHIPQSRIAAHRWTAPRRKADPTDWNDRALHTWIAALYAPVPGTMCRVIFDGSRVRTGPGTSFAIATFGANGPQIILPRDFTFISDTASEGEPVNGSRVWLHIIKPADWGWIHSSLVEVQP